MDRVKRIWYLSPMRAAKVQASLRIRAVSPEPSLLAHTSSKSRGTFRQKARSLAPLNGWACAVKVCHDGMLEGTNSLDGAHIPVCYWQFLKGAGPCKKVQCTYHIHILSSEGSRRASVPFLFPRNNTSEENGAPTAQAKVKVKSISSVQDLKNSIPSRNIVALMVCRCWTYM